MMLTVALKYPDLGAERAGLPRIGAIIKLLHCNRDVCVPGDVNLVANLNLIEHSRIDDMSAVFPSVRTNEGD